MTVNLSSYDRVIVAFSGGKDSLACLLSLIEMGVDLSRVELWHHDVDGREGSKLMDWSCTRDYCSKFAAAFGIPIYFSWLEGGFEREMTRAEQRKAPTVYETPEGIGRSGGVAGKLATRMKFPQVSPDLSVRWCSSYLKIDVASAAITGQSRFHNSRTLFVTGERAAESSARAKYAQFEPHRCDARDGRLKRHIDHYRPVHQLSTAEVWALIERHRINPHPAYRAGFGRVSCQFCIFGNANQCASARAISPQRFGVVAGYESSFGVTIDRKITITAKADNGTVYATALAMADRCNSETFDEPIILPEGQWTMPSGAFAESCGPT